MYDECFVQQGPPGPNGGMGMSGKKGEQVCMRGRGGEGWEFLSIFSTRVFTQFPLLFPLQSACKL